MSESRPQKQQDCALRLLPAYLDTHSIEEALQSARGRRILWLEILINDRLDFTPWEQDPAFQEVYRTACRWYTQYSGLMVRREKLRVRLLSPVDFIIAKLRRGTDLDHEDATFVARRFAVSASSLRDAAVAASRQDTALFLFNKTVELFCRNLTS